MVVLGVLVAVLSHQGRARFRVRDLGSGGAEQVATLVGAMGGHAAQYSAVKAAALPELGSAFVL